MSQHPVEPKRHRFGRHRSGSYLSRRSSSSSTADLPSSNAQPGIFEGTDAVLLNRKVALQRVIEAHQALERKYGDAPTPTSTTSERPTSSSSSISHDPFTTDFSDLSIPDAELRAFRYLLHKWDPSNYDPDAEIDKAIEGRKGNFEVATIKHFFGRVALWDASEEDKQAMSRSVFFFKNRRRRSRAKSDVSRMLGIPETPNEDAGLDALKEVTTREGLAQLLWTLLHTDEPATTKLREECILAVKEMYQMTITTDGLGQY